MEEADDSGRSAGRAKRAEVDSPDGRGGGRHRRFSSAHALGAQRLPLRFIAEVQTAQGKLYQFVATDRTSKFAFVQLVTSANRVMASAFLVALIAAAPCKIHTILADNAIQFRYPPCDADGRTARYMTHMFAMRCRENGIEHRFTKLNHPSTNGLVERMTSSPHAISAAA